MENNLNKKLIMAVRVGYLEGVQRLLAEGADPGWKDEEGVSAWDWVELLPLDVNNSNIKKMIKNSMVPYEEAKKLCEQQDRIMAALWKQRK